MARARIERINSLNGISTHIFLWFWFITLSILSFLVIVYRVIIIISPKMRAYLLYIRFRLIRREVINTIVKKSYVGDWFLFYMLGEIWVFKKLSNRSNCSTLTLRNVTANEKKTI